MSDTEDKPRSNGRFVAGTAVGVLAGVALTATALLLVPPKTITATPTTSSPTATSSASTTSVAPTTGPTSATPTPEATVSSGDLVTPQSGTWIAMIHWMPKATNSLAEASAYARNKSTGSQTVAVVDTDAVQLRGGKPGQYAVAVTGLASMGDATSACVALGLTPGAQCGRYQVA